VSLPAHITARVEEALQALYCHSERALLPWYRYAIYMALTIGAPFQGRAARVWLIIAAARHVLFCWQVYARGPWSRDWTGPDQLLTLAEQVMQGTVDHVRISTQLNRAHALADVAGEDVTSRWHCSWCVYEAALRALSAAWLYDQLRARCATNTLPPDETSCADDASTYAAIAIAGGMWHPIVKPAQGGVAVVGLADRGRTTAARCVLGVVAA